MLYQIKSQYTGAVLFDGDYPDLRDCVMAAVKAGANLQDAYLYGANLQGAYLYGAKLRYANLQGADLRDANLYSANLRYAKLQGANLQDAYLQGAYLADGVKATAGPARRATRADGHEFFLWPTDAGWRVKAGCRFFTMDEAWRHWEAKRGNTPLGDESLDILTMFELHIQRNGNP